MRARRAHGAAWWIGVAALLVAGHAAVLAAPRPTRPKPKMTAAQILTALQQIETQQADVLRQLEAAKSELAIIKVRAATIPSGICD